MSGSGSESDKAGAGSIGHGGVRERRQLVFCMELFQPTRKCGFFFKSNLKNSISQNFFCLYF